MMLYSTFSDQELTLLLGTDDGAYNEIYERHWASLYRAAFNVLKNEDATMDVIQDVFIWLWEHRNEIQVQSIKAYLLVAVKYKVANYLRNEKVRASVYERLPEVDDHITHPDEEIEIKQLKDIIANFVNELPERCQLVFNMSRNEHMSNKEIADRMGITEKTVENQINRALKKLKVKMGRNALLSIF
jgi:RNA polymerase sigma-70 factor (family 1)